MLDEKRKVFMVQGRATTSGQKGAAVPFCWRWAFAVECREKMRIVLIRLQLNMNCVQEMVLVQAQHYCLKSPLPHDSPTSFSMAYAPMLACTVCWQGVKTVQVKRVLCSNYLSKPHLCTKYEHKVSLQLAWRDAYIRLCYLCNLLYRLTVLSAQTWSCSHV